MNCQVKHFFRDTQYKLYITTHFIEIGKNEKNIKYKLGTNLSTVIKWIFRENAEVIGFKFYSNNKWKTVKLQKHFCYILRQQIDGLVTYQNLEKMFSITKQIRECYLSKIYLANCCIDEKKYQMQVITGGAFFNSQDYCDFLQFLDVHHTYLPNIKQIFFENKYLHIISEIVEGKTLFERMNSQYRMEENEIIFVLKGLLKFLNIIHQAGYVYRELDTKNIFLQKNGNLKLIDFESIVKIECLVRTKQKSKDSTQEQKTTLEESRSLNNIMEKEKILFFQQDIYLIGTLLQEMLKRKPMQKCVGDKSSYPKTQASIIVFKSTKQQLFFLKNQMIESNINNRITSEQALNFVNDLQFGEDTYQDLSDSSEHKKTIEFKEIKKVNFLF